MNSQGGSNKAENVPCGKSGKRGGKMDEFE